MLIHSEHFHPRKGEYLSVLYQRARERERRKYLPMFTYIVTLVGFHASTVVHSSKTVKVPPIHGANSRSHSNSSPPSMRTHSSTMSFHPSHQPHYQERNLHNGGSLDQLNGAAKPHRRVPKNSQAPLNPALAPIPITTTRSNCMLSQGASEVRALSPRQNSPSPSLSPPLGARRKKRQKSPKVRENLTECFRCF